MTWMRYLSSGLLLTLAACGDDEKTPINDTQDTSGSDTAAPDTGGWTGGDTGSPDTGGGSDTFTPNPSCDPREVDHSNWGTTFPWSGMDVEGTFYTCNKCPRGIGELQGTWRAHGFDDDGNPDYSKGASADNDDAETLIVDGNTFRSHMFDIQTGAEVQFAGYYFCSQKPEHPNEHLFWEIKEVDRPGTSGAEVGGVFRTDIILTQGADQRLLIYYDEITGDRNVQIGYCRVGSTYQGQVCTDPFQ